MRVYRDDLGTIWLVRDGHDEVPLNDLPPAKRTAVLDELVHDAKGEEAAAINNAGEEAQLAYLLEDRSMPRL